MLYEIYHDDCLVKMEDIPDKSIDMILCDLPYGFSLNECDWDVIIPMSAMWDSYTRIIKDGGAIVLFGQEPFSSELRMSNKTWYKYDWIWEKRRPTNFAHAKNCPLKIHELISVFSCGSINHATINGRSTNRMYYYPQGTIPCNMTIKNTTTKPCFGLRESHKSEHTITTTNYPKSILQFNSDNVDASLHPTQKPVKLLEYLIKTYTLENEVVLDNCMGSGSTSIACLNTNRRFIGIEKDETFFNVAKERLESHKKNIDTNIEQFFVE